MLYYLRRSTPFIVLLALTVAPVGYTKGTTPGGEHPRRQSPRRH